VSSSVASTSDVKGKVLVECVSDGPRLRIRAVSPGFHPHWNVQFPRDIRRAGAKYVVDELVESVNGGFYRSLGDIRVLSTATDKFHVLNVAQQEQLNTFVESLGHNFSKGVAFYEFTKKETIQKYKELVLMDKKSRDIFAGEAVRELLGLPSDLDVTIAPESFPKYKIFIQSASSNRGLQAGTQLLLLK